MAKINSKELKLNADILLEYSEAVIEPLSVTENGTYTAPEGVDGYSPVTVAVPVPTPDLEEKSVTVTENGTQQITPSAGFDGIGLINLITNVAGGGGDINSAILDYFHIITQQYPGSSVATTASLFFYRTARVMEAADEWENVNNFIFIHFPDATDPFKVIAIGWKNSESSGASWAEIYPEREHFPISLEQVLYLGDATEAMFAQGIIDNITGDVDFTGDEEYVVNNGALLVW